jgi:eukaryotic-like serine/threonine-protein kinase
VGNADAQEGPVDDPLIGAVLEGKYRIEAKIGQGGMGAVYLAVQEAMDRKVAVKVLLASLAHEEQAILRFEQEARAVSRMQHPNAVTVFDFGRTVDQWGSARLYLVMEFLKGRTLANLIHEQGHLSPVRACRIARQVCAALADAHSVGIVHRDLKPDNIMLMDMGAVTDWVKVLDFGVAKIVNTDGATALTRTGMLFGTPKYMAPEQADAAHVDHRADIYSLGCVVYEMLMGQAPFASPTPMGLLLKHLQEAPPRFASFDPAYAVPTALESIVMRALEKSPDHRYQSIVEFQGALETYERTELGGLTDAYLGSRQEKMKVPPDQAPTAQVAWVDASGGTLLGAHVKTNELPRPKVARPDSRPSNRTKVVAWTVGGIILFGGFLGAYALLEGERSSAWVESLPVPDIEVATPPAREPVERSERSLEPAPLAMEQTQLKEVKIRFRSTPPGAEVSVNGKSLGTTPFDAPFSASKNSLRFRFAKEGFVAAEKKLRPLKSRRLVVTLSPVTLPADPNPKINAPVESPPKVEPPRVDAESKRQAAERRRIEASLEEMGGSQRQRVRSRSTDMFEKVEDLK